MTKSTITREQLLEIIETDHVQCGEASYLARMALAAMDREPVAYMTYKGYLLHAGDPKLAEYSEPMPLYADPRPASTPAAPVAWDYEWASCITCEGPQNFNRVIEREAPPEWAVDEGQARNIIPLYRHAQTAPVVPEEKPMSNPLSMYAVDAVAAIAEAKGWNACRAAMLQHQPQNAQQNIPENIPGGLVEAVNNLLNNDGSRGCYDAMECGTAREKIELWLAQRQRWEEQRKANLSAGNSPVIPDGYRLQPISEYEAMCATVNSDEWPQRWIPVSERMPERGDYLVTDGRDFDVQSFDGWQFIPGFVWEDGITHWMPLPAAPQEVKGE